MLPESSGIGTHLGALGCGSWPSMSVRCAAAIFPEPKVYRTRCGARENTLMTLSGRHPAVQKSLYAIDAQKAEIR